MSILRSSHSAPILRLERRASTVEASGLQGPLGDGLIGPKATAWNGRPAWVTDRRRLGGRVIDLVGTFHSRDPDQDRSARYLVHPPREATTLFVEHCPSPEAAWPSYSRDDMERRVMDITQETLMKRAQASGVRIVGTDGRKALDASGRQHALSVRHKLVGRGFVFASEAADLVASQCVALRAAMGRFVDGALGCDASARTELVDRFADVLEYLDGTDVSEVVARTEAAVRAHAVRLSAHERVAVAAAVLCGMEVQIAEVLEYAASQHEAFAAAGALDHLHVEVVTDLVSAVNDALCNLLLCAAVVTDRAPHALVAFGNEHVRLVRDLLDSLGAR